MKKIILVLGLVSAINAYGETLKQIGSEVELEGTVISLWENETNKFEIRIRYPKNWKLVDFDREWTSWQGHMRGFNATFETPEGAQTIFYNMKLRPLWEKLLDGRSQPKFEEGIIGLTSIKWIRMK